MRILQYLASHGIIIADQAMRYALVAPQCLTRQGNTAHGVCYIALALRHASSKTELGKAVDYNIICAAEALLHMEEHLSSLRSQYCPA